MGGSTIVESMEQRDLYKSFWSGFSGKADNSSMMLNKNADELEAFDRQDILASLPDYTGMDVLDIGAGIGRFTSVFAQKARHVTSTDFIEQFIEKNRQRNAHFSNISYKVGDAIGLKMEPGSLGLVFSNWLMMYLSDEEVLHFLNNAILWLKPGGYLHVRESCSESSTGRVTTSLHNSLFINPTRYRYSSAYIQLLRAIRLVDAQGQQWRFDVQWACSVPTFIKYQNNWRQVHWLARKVRVEDSSSETATPAEVNKLLLHKFGEEWIAKQRQWDAIRDGERHAWTDEIFKGSLATSILKGAAVLSYNPRHVAHDLHVNAHSLAEHFSCQVWNVETNPYFYRTSLTKANQLKDQRVRFSWNLDLNSALKFWKNSSTDSGSFKAFVATELLSGIMKQQDGREELVGSIVNVLQEKGNLVSLEPVVDEGQETEMKTLLSKHFKSVSSIDLTTIAKQTMKQHAEGTEQTASALPDGIRWVLFNAEI